MNVKAKKLILTVLSLLLVAELGVAGMLYLTADRPDNVPSATEVVLSATIPTETLPAPTETDPPTEPPTEAPTEPPVTEPPIKHYTLSFAGDCTLGSIKKNWSNPNHFIMTIGEDYDYPFANVRQYFETDDFTIINLEGPLTDSTSGAQSKTFAFRGPTAYTQIMTGSSVEAVTLANNHALDYGQAGYDSTTKVLSEAGITYVEKNKTAMYTTESGLKIGLYAAAFDFSTDGIKKGIANLRNDGAEIVICAFHWGNEGEYRPTADQQKFAKVAIDAGADVVYGHHPHVLQKIEQYNGGYIFYSLGNFSFGGAALPQDYDTALLQLDVIRDENGKISLGELTIIPCSYKSSSGQNTFQPTPLAEGSEYDRIMKKLGGNFTGGNLKVDYGKLDPKPAETTPPAVTPDPEPETPAPAPDTGSSGGSSSGGSSSGGSSSDSSSSGGSSSSDSSSSSSSSSSDSSSSSSSSSSDSSSSSSSSSSDSSSSSSSSSSDSSSSSSSSSSDSSSSSSSSSSDSSSSSSSSDSSSSSGSSDSSSGGEA